MHDRRRCGACRPGRQHGGRRTSGPSSRSWLGSLRHEALRPTGSVRIRRRVLQAFPRNPATPCTAEHLPLAGHWDRLTRGSRAAPGSTPSSSRIPTRLGAAVDATPCAAAQSEPAASPLPVPVRVGCASSGLPASGLGSCHWPHTPFPTARPAPREAGQGSLRLEPLLPATTPEEPSKAVQSEPLQQHRVRRSV